MIIARWKKVQSCPLLSTSGTKISICLKKSWRDEVWIEKAALKVLGLINSLIPNFFFKHIEILVSKVESYLEGFVCGFHAQSRCSLGEISKKPSWKLENLVSTIYKTISLQWWTFFFFPNCLQMRHKLCNFSPMDNLLAGKVTISASLKKIIFQRFRNRRL